LPFTIEKVKLTGQSLDDDQRQRQFPSYEFENAPTAVKERELEAGFETFSLSI